ncbi:MAG: LamG-like jellyroll fold domain-containing protein [Candidatus Paracaedibacteraceae bacterium]|nr:LamG-like jellyroll fold domain-containing protein [Candidatus Paracaedibacteraceae bacterium]
MNLNLKIKDKINPSNQSLTLKGDWNFENDFLDSSGLGNDLSPNNSPCLIKDSNFSGAVKLDGRTQSLEGKNPAVNTEGSYTVAAWVRLDSSLMREGLSLETGEYALTAISQDTPTHSNFYLGLRQVDEKRSESIVISSLRWNFTVAPIDGTQTGPVEWQHAYTKSPLDDSILDKWFLLVGVCDAAARTASIYVPTINEEGIIHWPANFIQLPAKGGIQVGKGRWLTKAVDHWPGSIGPVKIFSGVMSKEEVYKIYNNL